MRTIKRIIIHCTATNPSATVEAIRNYWRNELGWKNPGYHYIIDRFGETTQLMAESGVANGARGFNASAIHVAYIGGVNGKDTRTKRQKAQLIGMVIYLKRKYPEAEVSGHRDLPGVTKDCPCFDAKLEYADVGKPKADRRV